MTSRETVMDRAQTRYDDLAAPEGGTAECPECGTGDDTCTVCRGSGYINDDGSAFDQREIDRMRDEAFAP